MQNRSSGTDEPRSLADFLRRAAGREPDRAAMVCRGNVTTYRAFLEQSCSFARSLKRLGMQKGNRVALLMPDIPQYPVSFYGVLLAEGMAVPLLAAAKIADLSERLKDAGAEIIVVSDRLLPRVRSLVSSLTVKRVVVTCPDDMLPLHRKWMRLFSFRRFREKEAVSLLSTDRMETITWRSMVSRKNVSCPAPASGSGSSRCTRRFDVRAVPSVRRRFVDPCQFDGQCGAVPQWPGSKKPRAEPDRGFGSPGRCKGHDGVYELRCFCGRVPGFRRFAGSGGKVGRSGLLRAGKAFSLTHVATEACQKKESAIGSPLADTECRIVDEDGRECSPGKVGELLVRGPQIPSRCRMHHGDTSDRLTDGWLHTGELVRTDRRGCYETAGKKQDRIVIGGFQVFPLEVEYVLHRHPGLEDAAVSATESGGIGKSLEAWLVPKKGRALHADSIRQFCRSRLPAYKVPRVYHFCDRIPKNENGETDRSVLQKGQNT